MDKSKKENGKMQFDGPTRQFNINRKYNKNVFFNTHIKLDYYILFNTLFTFLSLLEGPSALMLLEGLKSLFFPREANALLLGT